jgi:hypothetical protein
MSFTLTNSSLSPMGTQPLLRPGPARQQRPHRRPSGAGEPSRNGAGATLTYRDSEGLERELVVRAGLGGSRLVIDQDRLARADPRLVAHLGADEPPGNADLICLMYLQERPAERTLPRPLIALDCESEPFPGDPLSAEPRAIRGDQGAYIEARAGEHYRLGPVAGSLSIPELRWCRRAAVPEGFRSATVSVRDVVARLESYEPVRTLTADALCSRRGGGKVSGTVLRLELERVLESPILLNRRLRETVLATAQGSGLSMSEIAIRCGRVKHDRRGRVSGETSWLARRLGLLPEGGQSEPTPWIHSDVLGLIAREGLGISPREVEL